MPYLRNIPGAVIPEKVLENSRLKGLFAIYKEQLNVLLPQTLRRRLNEHYGVSLQSPERGEAIPYKANNTPNERSTFGNYLEAVNYSIQRILIEGAPPRLLKHYVKGLQAQARQEFLSDPALGAVANTPTARRFATWVGASMEALPLLLLEDGPQWTALFQKLYLHPEVFGALLETELLPSIQLDEGVLPSESFNHVALYRSCQGMTGTPSNSCTYHQRLQYNKHHAAATEGFMVASCDTKTALFSVGEPASTQLLNVY